MYQSIIKLASISSFFGTRKYLEMANLVLILLVISSPFIAGGGNEVWKLYHAGKDAKNINVGNNVNHELSSNIKILLKCLQEMKLAISHWKFGKLIGVDPTGTLKLKSERVMALHIKQDLTAIQIILAEAVY